MAIVCDCMAIVYDCIKFKFDNAHDESYLIFLLIEFIKKGMATLTGFTGLIALIALIASS